MASQTENPHLRNDTPNFDPIARSYRWMEYLSFGPMLEHCRFYFLANCIGARHALVLGDGDGRFTARLLATNRTVQIDAVDASAVMLAMLKHRAKLTASNAENRLHAVHADLRSFTPDRGEYDLIVSHFFLDCLTDEDLEQMVARIVPYLAPDATWILSEFAIPQKGWRRIAAHALIRLLYFAFKQMTHLQVQQIPDYGRIFARIGLSRRERVQFLGGLLVAEKWQKNNTGAPDLS